MRRSITVGAVCRRSTPGTRNRVQRAISRTVGRVPLRVLWRAWPDHSASANRGAASRGNRCTGRPNRTDWFEQPGLPVGRRALQPARNQSATFGDAGAVRRLRLRLVRQLIADACRAVLGCDAARPHLALDVLGGNRDHARCAHRIRHHRSADHCGRQRPSGSRCLDPRHSFAGHSCGAWRALVHGIGGRHRC